MLGIDSGIGNVFPESDSGVPVYHYWFYGRYDFPNTLFSSKAAEFAAKSYSPWYEMFIIFQI